MPRFLLVLVLFAATGCDLQTSNQVILATDDGTRKLIYDCSNFRPQVETGEQRQLLSQASVQIIRHASAHQRVVSAQAIRDAYKAKDWRRLEQLVVEYRCTNRREFR